MQYRSSLLSDSTTRYLAGSDVTTGLPLVYIQKIVAECHVFFPRDVFQKRYPLYDNDQANIVWSIMCDVLSHCAIFDDDNASISSGVVVPGSSDSETDEESDENEDPSNSEIVGCHDHNRRLMSSGSSVGEVTDSDAD